MNRGAAPRLSCCRGAACWIAVVASIAGIAAVHAAAPCIEFATAGASGRGVHPLRLIVDTSGPPRTSALGFELPEGSRFVVPPPRSVPEGEGAPASHVLHLLVLPEAPAGMLVLRGSLDGRPLEARLPVAGLPDFRVLGAPADVLVGLADAEVGAVLVVGNRGNTPLNFRVSAGTGDDGPRVAIEEGMFSLAPGADREVNVRLRAPAGSRVTSEHTIAVHFKGRTAGFARTDPVILRALFVPEKPESGPLFAVLEGNIDAGFHRENGRSGLGAQFRLSGEIADGVMLEARALDGDSSVLGSQLELAGRDTWHLSLKAQDWHATAGEARAPSLGFLAPGVYGRGLAAGLKREGWSADAFALRDSFAGSVREAAGVKLGGPGGSWEAGAILQRSRDITFAEEERAGVYAGSDWTWRGIKGRSEVAFAGSDGSGEGAGLAQSLSYKGERALVDARFEHADDGFFLQDQSSERQSLTAEWKAGPGWVLLAGADRSEQTGRLRTLLQDRDNSGGPEDPPEIVELINEVATRQASYNAGARREFGAGILRAQFRHQERAGEIDTLREFAEDTIELEWTGRSLDPWWRFGAGAGRESGDGGSARFAEFNASAYWTPTARSRIEGSARWTAGLSGEPRGFRREGIHGQLTGAIEPARGWKAELRIEGYDYADFEPRTRIGALVRFPVGRSGWSGAVEWARDTQSGDESAWLVVRAPLSIQMPWRPVRGTVGGRVINVATGAGMPSVLVSSGRHRAMSDSSGRYQLPAMEPGTRDIQIQPPGGWMRRSGEPSRAEIVAGKRDSLDIGLIELGTLRGEVVIVDTAGSSRPAPSGVLVAAGEGGATHETLVFRGVFTMRLPPGKYSLSFVSELPDEVSRQLAAEVTVAGTEPATVRLEAREQARRLRRTLLPKAGG